MNIEKGATLYSLKHYNTAGFPQEVTVTKVTGSTVFFKGGSISIQELSEWTTDWMTALYGWKGGAQ